MKTNVVSFWPRSREPPPSILSYVTWQPTTSTDTDWRKTTPEWNPSNTQLCVGVVKWSFSSTKHMGRINFLKHVERRVCHFATLSYCWVTQFEATSTSTFKFPFTFWFTSHLRKLLFFHCAYFKVLGSASFDWTVPEWALWLCSSTRASSSLMWVQRLRVNNIWAEKGAYGTSTLRQHPESVLKLKTSPWLTSTSKHVGCCVSVLLLESSCSKNTAGRDWTQRLRKWMTAFPSVLFFYFISPRNGCERFQLRLTDGDGKALASRSLSHSSSSWCWFWQQRSTEGEGWMALFFFFTDDDLASWENTISSLVWDIL